MSVKLTIPLKLVDRSSDNACCPPPAPTTLGRLSAAWADGTVNTPIGEVPRVRTSLGLMDVLGSVRVRLGWGRMRYTVRPGLYATGNPTPDSPVLVTANYKLSFDSLRSRLGGIDAWLIVLDTKGINVWCAAGKGTFGTSEVVGRIASTGLSAVVSHRTLVLPQLGAPGVSAHQVRRQSGFRAVFGPVRAMDIKEFLASGMKATALMRRVRFSLRDRLVLTPLELMIGMKKALLTALGFLLLSGLGPHGYSLGALKAAGPTSAMLFLVAYVSGCVIGPALLPWLPGRSFSAKGAWVGAVISGLLLYFDHLRPGLLQNSLTAASWPLMMIAVTSFMVMNFTGASTYTSLSGVKKEMRIALPLQIAGAVTGLGLWVAGRFVQGG